MSKGKILIILCLIVIILAISIKASDKSKIRETNTKLENYSGEEETQILLYFLNNDKTKLEKEYRYVPLSSIKDNMLETIVKELIKGPMTNDLTSVIPQDTKINSINQENNKVIIDLSSEFNTDSNEYDLQKIYSIVNSLTEIKEIDEVEIKINGETLTSEKRI